MHTYTLIINTYKLLLHSLHILYTLLAHSLYTNIHTYNSHTHSQALHQLLAKVNKELKALGGVNQKALDQYNTFKEQRRDLELRRVENKKYGGVLLW